MVDDTLLIGIISETVNAPTLARRQAAVILVEALRARQRFPALELDEELRALIRDFHVPIADIVTR